MLFQGTYDVYRSMLEIPNSLCLFFSRCAWSDRDDTIQSAMSPAVTLPGPGRELTAAFEKNLQNFWGFMFVNYDNGCCSSQKCSQSIKVRESDFFFHFMVSQKVHKWVPNLVMFGAFTVQDVRWHTTNPSNVIAISDEWDHPLNILCHRRQLRGLGEAGHINDCKKKLIIRLSRKNLPV